LNSGRRRAEQRLARTLLAALIALELVGMSVSTYDLAARRSSDEIHVTTPRLHFLTGRTLQRLHDGAVVPFDFQLTIAAGARNNVVARAWERFSVSYDVWQEKFSVVRMRDLRKSSYTLSANAAESWCVENIFVPVSLLPAGKELWARLEVRSVEQKDIAPSVSDPVISVTTLIGIFSRPARPQQDHWSLESPPFHLADLKQ
jgi:hypothetical protein